MSRAGKKQIDGVLKAVVLVPVLLYALIMCLVGFGFGGGWRAGVGLGFLAVAVGACLSWGFPAGGGLLIVLGAILGSTSLGVSGYACVWGRSTCSTSDEIGVSIALGVVPGIVGLCFLAMGLGQRGDRPQA